MSSTKSLFVHQLSERQFQRFVSASHSHQSARADRIALGSGPCDPTVLQLAAVDEADAAMKVTGQELDAALAEYLYEPAPLGVLWHGSAPAIAIAAQYSE